MTTATARRVKNPTQADIIRILIVQEKADVQKRLDSYIAETRAGTATNADNIARTRGAIATLDILLRKVDRYLAGDMNVLVR